MALKLGSRVEVKKLPESHPLAALSGRKGEVVQVGDGPHARPEATISISMDKGASATCPDKKKVLVDSQWINGSPMQLSGGVVLPHFREWFLPDEIELG